MTRPTKGKKAKLPLMPIQQQQIGNQLSRPKKTQPRDTRGLGNSRERPKRPAEIDPSLHEESDEEEEEDEDQEEDGEEQCHTVRLYLPPDTNPNTLQKLLDNYYYQDKDVPFRPCKRKYDNLRFGDQEAILGVGFFDKLNRLSRRFFCRHLWIFEKYIPGLIDQSAGQQVDRDTPAFTKAYGRVQEWTKNWSCDWTKEVDALCTRLVESNDVDHTLSADRLAAAYIRHYKYKHLWGLLGTNQSLIDVRATILTPKGNTFYQTVFTWCLVYAHRAKYSKGDDALTRAEYLKRVRVIGAQKSLQPILMEDLMLLPEKPVSKIRKVNKKKVTPEDTLGEDFEVFLDPILEAELREWELQEAQEKAAAEQRSGGEGQAAAD